MANPIKDVLVKPVTVDAGGHYHRGDIRIEIGAMSGTRARVKQLGQIVTNDSVRPA